MVIWDVGWKTSEREREKMKRKRRKGDDDERRKIVNKILIRGSFPSDVD